MDVVAVMVLPPPSFPPPPGDPDPPRHESLSTGGATAASRGAGKVARARSKIQGEAEEVVRLAVVVHDLPDYRPHSPTAHQAEKPWPGEKDIDRFSATNRTVLLKVIYVRD